ncbi:NADH-quinone oxidoreductase subunit L [Methylosarcina fibrata]|uniref:NADH-quinone oxidoreductase subunit L n=1 Tax=Methylosarcina fibrata TaxID=105972 RepID=UPI000379D3F9|nr:NADH-quinone oxidoreductase subunit L [Methylosarcina fibrata]
MTLLWLVPLFPLAGFLLLALFGSRFNKSAVAWIGAGSVGLSAAVSAWVGADYLTGNGEPFRLTVASWLAVDDLTVPFALYLDALSLTMLWVVTGVGLLIHVYSAAFMEADPGYSRFFAYMNLFVFAMLVLVLADNLAVLYLGWEGVGLGSYLLIGFWYENPENGYAARKAFVMTRVGDTFLLLGLLLLLAQLQTLDVPSVMRKAEALWKPGEMWPVAVSALLLGGAVGKSAQLPLQTWLPDAMAGPTPVSALIHAATMVTAGVYLIARTHPLFLMAPSVQFVVALIGAATLLLAGFAALAQTDIKRILAYSTISQIGYMFLALGVGAWSAGIFHLMTHAFFKALLFLAAGAVIFGFHHEHNIFRMGGLRKAMPVAFWSFVIGSAALSGLPFTSGYYSKHEILMGALAVSPVLWAAACFGALVTGIYSFRLVFVAFFGPDRARLDTALDWRMRGPLLLLGLLALIGGLLQIPLDSVFPGSIEGESRSVWAAFITVAAPITGLLIAFLLYLTGWGTELRLASNEWLKPVQQFWYDGWAFDRLYGRLWVRPFKALAELNKNDVVDAGYAGIVLLARHLHRIAGATQNGRLRRYAASMGVGAVFILALSLLS